ncbi:MAG: hypothetical protein E7000_04330 [Coriobacteriaceae bacterium]|nr:hypothetical protein [Coriobacteriaceae bacterium]
MSKNSALLDIAAAQEWKRENPELHRERIVKQAIADAAAERPISVHSYIVRIREKDRVNRHGQPVKVNDHFGPVWGRELWRDYPELRKWLRIRRAEELDEIYGIRSDHFGIVEGVANG